MFRNAIGVLVALVLAGSAAYGVDYSFTGPSGSLWDAAGTWTPALVLPGTTGDSYKMTTGRLAADCITLPNPGTGNTRYFGGIQVDCGTVRLPSAVAGTYVFSTDNGQSGSFILQGAATSFSRLGGSTVKWVIGDDFICYPSANTSGLNGSTIVMKGTTGIYYVRSYSETYNTATRVIVDNGAGTTFQGTQDIAQNFEIWGTATGQIYQPAAKTENTRVPGSGNASGLNVTVYPYSGDTNVWGATVTNKNTQSGDSLFVKGRFQDVEYSGVSWFGAGGEYRTHLPGDLRARNLRVGYAGGANSPYMMTLILDTDNQFIGTSNLVVDCDVDVGPSSTSSRMMGALRVRSSSVDIGGNIRFRWATFTNPADCVPAGVVNRGAWIEAATAQIQVGGNFTVDCGPLSAVNWNLGQSTVIFDGNGASKAQSIAAKGLTFYHVTINNPGGVVTLADNIGINGNFHLQAGVLRGSGYINMHGGQSTIDTAQTILADNAVGSVGRLRVQSGSSTWVKLLSNLKVTDNLVIDAGCDLFLNGFTLTVTGGLDQGTYAGDGVWTTRAGGQIIGLNTVPEPATLLLLGSGLLGSVGYVRRRRMA